MGKIVTCHPLFVFAVDDAGFDELESPAVPVAVLPELVDVETAFASLQ
jgi:hypothetical protein